MADATQTQTRSKALAAMAYSRQAERLSYVSSDEKNNASPGTMAVEAKFVTAHDPVVVTASGGRLPLVPVDEAKKLNRLKKELDGVGDGREDPPLVADDASTPTGRGGRKRFLEGEKPVDDGMSSRDASGDVAQAGTATSGGASAPLRDAVPPSRTTPLFPPIPLYGPPGFLLHIQSLTFRVVSFLLSFAFLTIVILGAIFTSLPTLAGVGLMHIVRLDPDKRRPFYDEEVRRRKVREELDRVWQARPRSGRGREEAADGDDNPRTDDTEFEPTEGGPDPIVCDIGYYARRVGLDAEEYEVQTEDGFIISLWHIYNPKEHRPAPAERRRHRSPEVFSGGSSSTLWGLQESADANAHGRKPKYPILLMHGLLQSSGAYCANDDDSFAFFLCKTGYDVWLGDNRCGFEPRHTILTYSEPRMWAWNIRQMGVLDLPAFVSRVLAETGFDKLALISHSQGTTQAFVALAKEQRPEIGRKISVFCALAPAVYAGPLIGKAYFKFMRIISPAVFRLMFGIHAFIPLMPTMHAIMPSRLYGALGYRVFSFLFDWTDVRWERDIRDRLFQFAPTYVSAESMRWWLGKDCFAKHKCILATRDERKLEEQEDEKADRMQQNGDLGPEQPSQATPTDSPPPSGLSAWYDDQVPPFALWVAGSDGLVDGRKLLRRFERGREPNVRVVHAKVIDEYEHLDVIWAMDAIEKVGHELRDVVWQTVPDRYRGLCRVPHGCSTKTIDR